MNEPVAVPKVGVSVGPNGVNGTQVPAGESSWAGIIARLPLMKEMKENWDGYGAEVPHADLIDASIKVAESLARPGDLSPPYVSPTPTGGVLFAWQQGAHQVELEVESPDRLSFLYFNRETDESIEAEGHLESLVQDANIREQLSKAAVRRQ